jgi:N-acyl homoserine lactone hydrolase
LIYVGIEEQRGIDTHPRQQTADLKADHHTPGSVIVFVTLPHQVRYALVGDRVWQREGLTRRLEGPYLIRRPGDFDAEGNRQSILRMSSIMQRIPDLIVVPAHDQ